MMKVEMVVTGSGSRLDEILRTSRWLMGQSEAEPGLKEMDLYRSVEKEEKVVLAQRWRSREDLVRYMRTEEFIRLLEILDLSEQPPELYFDSVQERQGLEFVEAIRNQESVNGKEVDVTRRRG